MKDNNGTITEFYPDGSIKSFSKDGISVFRQDVNGNVGVGPEGGKSLTIDDSRPLRIGSICPEHKLTIENSGSGAVSITSPPTKLIIISDNTIHVEDKPIGNSEPMKRVIINKKEYKKFKKDLKKKLSHFEDFAIPPIILTSETVCIKIINSKDSTFGSVESPKEPLKISTSSNGTYHISPPNGTFYSTITPLVSGGNWITTTSDMKIWV